MKIVIDISKDDYKEIQNGIAVGYLLRKGEIAVLPKGHGRLIDADAYAKRYRDTNINGRIGEEYIIAPTVLEADKESVDDSN